MFSFADAHVVKAINECDSFIKIKYEEIAKKIVAHNDIQDDYFVAALNAESIFILATVYAWSDFYSRFGNNTSLLDKLTVFNRESLGQRIAFTAEMARSKPAVFLSDLLRIMTEINFWEGGSGLLYSRNDVLTKLANEYNSNDCQFAWIRDTLQIAMAKYILESKDFKDALKLVSNLSSETEKLHEQLIRGVGEITGTADSAKIAIGKDFDLKKEELSTLIENKEKEVQGVLSDISSNLSGINEIEARLSKYHSEFNFVGLYSGFRELKKDKDKELAKVNFYYHFSMAMAIVLPLLSIWMHLFLPQLVNGKSLIEWVSWSAPLAAIELLILYYARVIYSEVKSLRTQLVQINLRGALCQFIEEYMNYRKKMKNEKGELNDAALDKFDSLIFSAIQMDSDNIPGALDGINAIAELAGKVLAKGK